MLIFDADGLIKLNHAGVLGLVVQNYESLVPAAVHDEAVLRGVRRGYEDAAEIGRTLEVSAVAIPSDIEDNLPRPGPMPMGLGTGETQALYHALRQPGDTAIASDDRKFLGSLLDLSVPFVVPSHVILGLARDGLLSVPGSRSAMDRLRPFIRTADYLEAIETLGE